MACAHKTTNHYLNQWWPSLVTHICVIRHQWVTENICIIWWYNYWWILVHAANAQYSSLFCIYICSSIRLMLILWSYHSGLELTWHALWWYCIWAILTYMFMHQVNSGPCITIVTWSCHKNFSQWEHSFSLKAALPLAERVATASDHCCKTGPWSSPAHYGTTMSS